MDKLFLIFSLLSAFKQSECACFSYHPYLESATHLFMGADRDRNGILERSELDESFIQYDSNHDGRIGLYEYHSFLMLHAGECINDLALQIFKDYDSDGDSYLDKHDFDIYYAKLDLNGDGIVSSGEFIQHWMNLFQRTEYIHGNWTILTPV